MELLQELYQINVGRAELPLKAFYSARRWQVWTRSEDNTMPGGQGLSVEARNGEKEGKRPRARLIPEEFALHSGRIGACDKIGSDGGESPVDTARREVVIEFVHDVCEGEYGGTAMSVGSPGRGEREPETARARDEVGVGNGR